MNTHFIRRTRPTAIWGLCCSIKAHDEYMQRQQRQYFFNHHIPKSILTHGQTILKIKCVEQNEQHSLS